ncbi:molybdenum cofactor guanylyltransferase MobA [Mesorhizobium sp. ES1-1]|uniref:molybdenum cofactor guanylyltransferase MobA n=1 Tax=Mesorhizobium sp. ES1-1 TaxID=2876629 RepID=UPI001CCF61B8|nr:molybdenum cofactor guanylyltransferase MobA [Mesorhizobium sp. ES1-1]MBZ9677660.1 molybdenum cofactor guanylyltransferase MobA [Mesorhizobium sp. ES1-1]
MNRDVAGIILAGGRSRRMGGGDKSLLALGGARLLDHVIARFAPQVGTLVLSANGDPGRFAGLSLPVRPDTVAGFAGPLAGVLAGLDWAAENTRCPYLVTAAGDTPFLPENLVERLMAATTGIRGSMAVASSGSRQHPTFALWPLDCRDDLRRFLVDEGNKRVSAFMDRRDCIEVDFPIEDISGVSFDPFFNINTPDDLAEAERLSQSMIA